MPELNVQGLGFSFSKGKTILHDINFSLAEGELTLLLGRNGSGKSVLLKTLKGLLQPKEGTITIGGKDLTRQKDQRLREVALVFQDAWAPIVGHTVEKDIRFGMENMGIPLDEQDKRLKEITSFLELGGKLDQDPRTLSGGESRRLAIAGVLVMAPRILMLDEPFAGLDWPAGKEVITSLLALKKTGVTILVVSHEADKLLAHADHVLVMEQGTLVEDGIPKEIISHLPSHDIFIPKNSKLEELSWLSR